MSWGFVADETVDKINIWSELETVQTRKAWRVSKTFKHDKEDIICSSSRYFYIYYLHSIFAVLIYG